MKVTLPGVGGNTITVPTKNGPGEYMLCSVPPAVPLVNVSSIVSGHEADIYAPRLPARNANQRSPLLAKRLSRSSRASSRRRRDGSLTV